MITDAVQLHTAARRYCIERHGYWAHEYNVRATSETEGKQIYPRYHVLNAILVEVERFDPSSFSSLDNARKVIITAGNTAHDNFTRASEGSIEESLMNEERQAFQRFVQDFPMSELASVERLFYRRVLSTAESEEVWKRLQAAWSVIKGEYWFPLAESQRNDVEAFQAPYFRRAVRPEKLQTILQGQGLSRIWELREYGPEYELDLSAFEPYYSGAEGYWCSEQMDWIIYASHEGSITVGGEWLLTVVKNAWPEWSKHVWTNQYF